MRSKISKDIISRSCTALQGWEWIDFEPLRFLQELRTENKSEFVFLASVFDNANQLIWMVCRKLLRLLIFKIIKKTSFSVVVFFLSFKKGHSKIYINTQRNKNKKRKLLPVKKVDQKIQQEIRKNRQTIYRSLLFRVNRDLFCCFFFYYFVFVIFFRPTILR